MKYIILIILLAISCTKEEVPNYTIEFEVQFDTLINNTLLTKIAPVCNDCVSEVNLTRLEYEVYTSDTLWYALSSDTDNTFYCPDSSDYSFIAFFLKRDENQSEVRMKLYTESECEESYYELIHNY